VWKIVFGNRRYIFLTVFIALFFYALNAMIGSWQTFSSLSSSYGILGTTKLFFVLVGGFGNTIKFHSYVSLILVSILFGLLFSLISYKTTRIKKTSSKVGVIASFGVFIGILAPGCAACSIGLLSLLGVSSAFLTFLPFEGLELSILSIGLLSFAVFKISEKIHVGEVCEVRLK